MLIATEIMAACQAIDFRENVKLGRGTSVAYRVVRENLSFIEEDRIMYKDLDKCTELLSTRTLINEVEKVVNIEY
jgi:histidine ammonia-lyase